jgi:hypothetical protein
MNKISSEDAVLLLDKWKSEGTSLTAFCVTPVSATYLLEVRVQGLSSESVQLLGNAVDLRVLLSEAVFVYWEAREVPSMEDFPGQLGEFTFEGCLRIMSANGINVTLFSHLKEST